MPTWIIYGVGGLLLITTAVCVRFAHQAGREPVFTLSEQLFFSTVFALLAAVSAVTAVHYIGHAAEISNTWFR